MRERVYRIFIFLPFFLSCYEFLIGISLSHLKTAIVKVENPTDKECSFVFSTIKKDSIVTLAPHTGQICSHGDELINSLCVISSSSDTHIVLKDYDIQHKLYTLSVASLDIPIFPLDRLPIIFLQRDIESTRFIKLQLLNEFLTYDEQQRLQDHVILNPSILRTSDGYLVTLRTSDRKFYTTTKNVLASYTASFQPKTQCIIGDVQEDVQDARLFFYDNSYWLVGCGRRAFKEEAYFPQAIFVELQPREMPGLYSKKNVVIPKSFNYCKEKNWLPFVLDDQLLIINFYAPFTILKLDAHTGNWTFFLQERFDYLDLEHDNILYKSQLTLPYNHCSELRGSAAPIIFDDGYLMMVHKVGFLNRSDGTVHKDYFHQLLYFDNQFHLKKASKFFVFKKMGIEFCSAMTIDHTGNSIIFSLGIDDREAWLCIIDIREIRMLLKTLPF